jgi:hypothetical protein
VSRDQKTKQIRHMKTGDKLLENVGGKKLSYLATTANQNCMQEEIKS